MTRKFRVNFARTSREQALEEDIARARARRDTSDEEGDGAMSSESDSEDGEDDWRPGNGGRSANNRVGGAAGNSNGGAASTAGEAQNKCSLCGQRGHNRRSCTSQQKRKAEAALSDTEDGGGREAKKMLADLEAQYKKLERENGKLERNMALMKANLANLSQQSEAFQKELAAEGANSRRMIEELQKERDALKSEGVKLEGQRARALSHMRHSDENRLKLEKDLNDLQNKFAAQQEELNSYQQTRDVQDSMMKPEFIKTVGISSYPALKNHLFNELERLRLLQKQLSKYEPFAQKVEDGSGCLAACPIRQGSLVPVAETNVEKTPGNATMPPGLKIVHEKQEYYWLNTWYINQTVPAGNMDRDFAHLDLTKKGSPLMMPITADYRNWLGLQYEMVKSAWDHVSNSNSLAPHNNAYFKKVASNFYDPVNRMMMSVLDATTHKLRPFDEIVVRIDESNWMISSQIVFRDELVKRELLALELPVAEAVRINDEDHEASIARKALQNLEAQAAGERAAQLAVHERVLQVLEIRTGDLSSPTRNQLYYLGIDHLPTREAIQIAKYEPNDGSDRVVWNLTIEAMNTYTPSQINDCQDLDIFLAYRQLKDLYEKVIQDHRRAALAQVNLPQRQQMQEAANAAAAGSAGVPIRVDELNGINSPVLDRMREFTPYSP